MSSICQFEKDRAFILEQQLCDFNALKHGKLLLELQVTSLVWLQEGGKGRGGVRLHGLRTHPQSGSDPHPLIGALNAWALLAVKKAGESSLCPSYWQGSILGFILL